MTALDARKEVQHILGVEEDGAIGVQTLNALNSLKQAPDDSPWPPGPTVQSQGWPFALHVDGEDLVSDPDIVITAFGGAFDPQDDGQTSSGVNTKLNPGIEGVSIAMDGRAFPHLSPAEHAALDGAPCPRIPFRTLVAVTIHGVTLTPLAGVIDLGPGRQASKPGAPHALDLTVAAAAHFAPNMSPREIATSFEARGQFRIIGGAKYLLTGSISSAMS